MTELLGLTPSATVGPFLTLGLSWPDGAELVESTIPGAITISGTLFDGAAVVVPDGLIETWQADPAGRFDHPDDPRGASRYPGFRGFGRSATDANGRFWLRTLKPGPLPAADGRTEAPHLNVSVFARGMLNRVITRIYFPDEQLANSLDPVLEMLDEQDRSRLVAMPTGPARLTFDLRLQGDGQTPFFRL